METDTLTSLTIGEMVAQDFRLAEIFKNNRIDFCCGGKKSLSEVCQESNLNQQILVREINLTRSTPTKPGQDFRSWKLDFLCDYICNTHHQYVLQTLPQLLTYTQKIAEVHGDHHPELIELAVLFSKINEELSQHLKQEEEVLFPAIKHFLIHKDQPSKEIIDSEIARMVGEHDFAGGAMDYISKLTQHYKLPEDSCNTYAVAFKLLEQFEDDLHIHVHLENNILYPAALNLK